MVRTLTIALTALALAVPAGAKQTVNETPPAAAAGLVAVENVSGSIKVTGWDRNEVAITGTLGDQVEKLDVQTSGDRMTIEVRLPSGSNRGGNRDLDANLEIRVPRASRLQVETVSAGIEVGDVGGSQELESVSGSVTVQGTTSQLSVQTVSGSIKLSGQAAEVRAESVSGSLELAGVGESLNAETVSGSLTASAGSLSRAQLSSVSGRVSFTGDLANGGRLEAESHSGSVELRLPASIAADFEVETFSGDISNDFGPPAERKGSFGPGKNLRFSTGSAARISVETFSGSVKLKQQ